MPQEMCVEVLGSLGSLTQTEDLIFQGWVEQKENTHLGDPGDS